MKWNAVYKELNKRVGEGEQRKVKRTQKKDRVLFVSGLKQSIKQN